MIIRYEWIGYRQYVLKNIRFQYANLDPLVTSLQSEFGERAVDKSTVAKFAELQLIFAYRNRFGDQPPANIQSPHYDVVEKWVKTITRSKPSYSDETGMMVVPGFDLEAPFHDLVD